jgi:putative DNA primase/helicase
MIFNCANGSIDLTNGRLLEHQKSKRITKFAPIIYDENGECPQWLNFLKSIFKKNKHLIHYVQKVLGMSLTGDVSEQAMFILYGTGANGKSTFINTIMQIMGDYGTNTPTETFMQKKGNTASNDIARLNGTRFVAAMEGDCGEKLAEAVVKRLTGNDRISARFLYGEYFEFIPTFKIFMATNHKPKISGLDNAIWRRIKLIPFEVSFSGRQQDPKLQQKLETELPGILAWMVEGCLQWQNEGLGNPPEIMEATNEYRHEMSAIETFLEEECHRDDIHEMTKSSLLYEAYKHWAENNNEYIMSNRSFSIKLAESGMLKQRLSTGQYWLGLSLNKPY